MGYWPKGHLHPFEQNRGRGGGHTARPVRPAPVIAGAPGSAVAGGRGKRRGEQGLLIPALTLVGGGLWMWLRGEERTTTVVNGGGANGGGGGARESCGGSVAR
jgi:hypothetical protein